MNDDMPRPRLPHLHRERGHWIYRVGHGPRTRLTAPFGTPEFLEQYHAAARGEAPANPRKPGKDSLAWLWQRYRESAAWQTLSPATKRQRENIMRGVIEKAGTAHISEITRKVIVDGRDRRSETPAMARHFVRTMTGLFRWALDAELIEIDPTVNVSVPQPKTEGHHVWTIEEIQKFQERWPPGTRERLAFDVLLFTGLRRGDAVTLGKQHIRNGVITLKTEKTGETVRIPVLPMLAESIAAGPTGALAIIAGERGEPMTKESFGNWFGAVCRATGVLGTAHGLRKALATIASEEGISEKGLDAVFGWRGGGMAALYTKTANRERLAADAMARLEHRLNDLFPQQGKMREQGQKS